VQLPDIILELHGTHIFRQEDFILAFYVSIISGFERDINSHGFIFESDTDTEVIPKLAKFVFDKAHDEKGIDLFL
jgi:hypothetical protein